MRYGFLIGRFGLVLNPLRALAVAIALGLGWAGPVQAQKPAYCPPAPNYVPPKGAPLTGAAPPAFSDQLATAPSLNLGEAAPAQTGENFAFSAPNFVGDFFGGAAAAAGGSIIDQVVLGTAPPITYAGTVFQNNNTPLVANDVNPTGFFFTTVGTQQQIFGQVNAGAQLPIQDNATFQAFANSYFINRNGNIGTTAFNQAGSYATVLPGQINSLGFIDATYSAQYAYDYFVSLNLPSPGSGSVVGIQKLVENSSPIPRDRLLFNYSMFSNVQFTPGGLDVNRFVVGFEKTFLAEACSFELRVPFASTLSSDQFAGQAAATNTEFGNLTMYLKGLMTSGPNYAVGAGLGIALPTADNINVRNFNGVQLVQVKNQSTHLLPYVGGVYAPSDRLFTQAILQIDTPASGNATLINNGAGLTHAGSLNDPTWMFASFNVGYWIYRDSPALALSGISPLMELHYNTTLNDTDQVTSGAFQVGNRFGTLEMINMVFGVNLEMFGRNYISLAYVTPVSGGADRFFDGEFRVLCNRYWW